MGLDIGVGWLARWRREVDSDEFLELKEPYEALNEILEENGLPAHGEPLDIAEEEVFEAQMWGYAGLHTVRRLAAYSAIRGRLPTIAERELDAAEDPVLGALYQEHDRHFSRLRPGGWLERILSPRRVKPAFQHLLCHSDCEGFYVPQAFDEVLFDKAEPQRTSIGGMVGSAQALLDECRELAGLIDLPQDIDPEAEELWAVADSSIEGQAKWQAFGIEAFCLARLLRGCELSIRHRAVLVFG